LAAFAYERRWYNAAQANWPDFRRSGGTSRTARQFSTAWCHGAPGIALSRLRARHPAPTPEIASELYAALETTRRATAAMLNAPETSFCLCHGLTGNAEVLNLCADGAEPSLVWRVATHCRRSARAETAPSPDAAPGLMLGRSGIGLFYLRLFDPSVPSALLPYP
jgi:lantibiotic biosynthesis protein